MRRIVAATGTETVRLGAVPRARASHHHVEDGAVQRVDLELPRPVHAVEGERQLALLGGVEPVPAPLLAGRERAAHLHAALLQVQLLPRLVDDVVAVAERDGDRAPEAPRRGGRLHAVREDALGRVRRVVLELEELERVLLVQLQPLRPHGVADLDLEQRQRGVDEARRAEHERLGRVDVVGRVAGDGRVQHGDVVVGRVREDAHALVVVDRRRRPVDQPVRRVHDDAALVGDLRLADLDVELQRAPAALVAQLDRVQRLVREVERQARAPLVVGHADGEPERRLRAQVAQHLRLLALAEHALHHPPVLAVDPPPHGHGQRVLDDDGRVERQEPLVRRQVPSGAVLRLGVRHAAEQRVRRFASLVSAFISAFISAFVSVSASAVVPSLADTRSFVVADDLAGDDVGGVLRLLRAQQHAEVDAVLRVVAPHAARAEVEVVLCRAQGRGDDGAGRDARELAALRAALEQVVEGHAREVLDHDVAADGQAVDAARTRHARDEHAVGQRVRARPDLLEAHVAERLVLAPGDEDRQPVPLRAAALRVVDGQARARRCARTRPLLEHAERGAARLEPQRAVEADALGDALDAPAVPKALAAEDLPAVPAVVLAPEERELALAVVARQRGAVGLPHPPVQALHLALEAGGRLDLHPPLPDLQHRLRAVAEAVEVPAEPVQDVLPRLVPQEVLVRLLAHAPRVEHEVLQRDALPQTHRAASRRHREPRRGACELRRGRAQRWWTDALRHLCHVCRICRPCYICQVYHARHARRLCRRPSRCKRHLAGVVQRRCVGVAPRGGRDAPAQPVPQVCPRAPRRPVCGEELQRGGRRRRRGRGGSGKGLGAPSQRRDARRVQHRPRRRRRHRAPDGDGAGARERRGGAHRLCVGRRGTRGAPQSAVCATPRRLEDDVRGGGREGEEVLHVRRGQRERVAGGAVRARVPRGGVLRLDLDGDALRLRLWLRLCPRGNRDGRRAAAEPLDLARGVVLGRPVLRPPPRERVGGAPERLEQARRDGDAQQVARLQRVDPAPRRLPAHREPHVRLLDHRLPRLVRGVAVARLELDGGARRRGQAVLGAQLGHDHVEQRGGVEGERGERVRAAAPPRGGVHEDERELADGDRPDVLRLCRRGIESHRLALARWLSALSFHARFSWRHSFVILLLLLLLLLLWWWWWWW